MDLADSKSNDEAIFKTHRAHTSGARIHTDSAICHAILDQYPQHCVTATKTDLSKFAEAGNASMQLVSEGPPLLLSRDYGPQLSTDPLDHVGEPDSLTSRIYFGCYDYRWLHHSFRVFVANVQNHLGPTVTDTRTYIVSEPAKGEVAGRSISKAADDLIRTVGAWAKKSHREVWLFDQGKWQKNRALWVAVRDASFEDVVGSSDEKDAIRRDSLGFFHAREQYERYGVPWKVGSALSLQMQILMDTARTNLPRSTGQWQDTDDQSHHARPDGAVYPHTIRQVNCEPRCYPTGHLTIDLPSCSRHGALSFGL